MKNRNKSPVSKAEPTKLQVREYIERYHPDLRDAETAVNRNGMFASVRERPRGKKNKKASD